jgi:hypothetical protein
MNITSSITNKQKQENSSSSAWTANGIKFNTHIRPPSPMENAQINADQSVVFLDISKGEQTDFKQRNQLEINEIT